MTIKLTDRARHTCFATVAAMAAVLGSAAPALAAPSPHGITVGEARAKAGAGQELAICNKFSQDALIDAPSGVLSNLLGGVLGGGGVGLYDQCASIPNEVPADTPLTKIAGRQNVAICQKSGNTAQEGLINVGTSCVALASVL